ncbi:MAG: dTDP-4-dehydrorhamnose reductase [Flavobacteriaceae bacterium]|nr:dTDP-4-dehydrorhamnose reductase [Flavobacteriaceae bacterium]
MNKVLVTGANGQLGLCLQEISKLHPTIQFVFSSSKELDITNKESVKSAFETSNYKYCINCAAYTNVDLAESDFEKAEKVNVIAVKSLAEACKNNNTKLIHVSTDFVFDGKSYIPYTENDETNPLSVYGKTKLDGEKKIQDTLKEFFILRTSWLYSEYANNFMKTMLRLGSERSELAVISDQIGSPTYAKDLARVIVEIIESDSNKYGVYHYSNEGVASWYDFANAIFDLSNTKIIINAIPTTAYPTSAERPHYSVLDKSKLKTNLGIEIPYWRASLKEAISLIK